VSLEQDRRDYWAIGRYDEKTMTFTPDDPRTDIGNGTQLLDYGTYYASKSFNDTKNGRRVLFGWVAEERPVDDQGNPYGWASIQALPRQLKLDDNSRRLQIDPIDETSQLRISSSYVQYTDVDVTPNTPYQLPMIPGQQYEIILKIDATNFTLNGQYSDQLFCGVYVGATADLTEYTDVGVMFGGESWFLSNINLLLPTYQTSTLEVDDPRMCGDICLSDTQCFAWSYNRNGLLCSLKEKSTEVYPYTQPCSLCTSGVKITLSQLMSYLYSNTLNSSSNPDTFK
jgi:hypothetical protein